MWRATRGWRVALGYLVVLLIVGASMPTTLQVPVAVAVVPITAFAVIGGVVAWTTPWRVVRRRLRDQPGRLPIGPRSLTLDGRGIHTPEGSVAWDAVVRVTVYRHHLLLVTAEAPVAIPRRAFGGVAAEDAALAAVRAWRQGEHAVQVRAVAGRIPGPYAPPERG